MFTSFHHTKDIQTTSHSFSTLLSIFLLQCIIPVDFFKLCIKTWQAQKGVSKGKSWNFFLLFNKHRLNPEVFIRIELLKRNMQRKYLMESDERLNENKTIYIAWRQHSDPQNRDLVSDDHLCSSILVQWRKKNTVPCARNITMATIIVAKLKT